MPFDGIGRDGRIDALDKLERVADLLGREDRWCKQQLRSYDGRRCILGAMMASDATVILKEPMLRAIKEVTGRDFLRIEMFNDHPSTNHGLVMTVLNQARSDLLQGLGTAPATAPTRWTSFNPITQLRRVFA